MIFVRNKLQVQKSNDLFSVRDKLRPDQWLKAAMIIWAIFWIILIIQLVSRIPGKRWTAISGLIIVIGCILAYFTQLSSTYKEGQYILTQTLKIEDEDLEKGQEFFSLDNKEDKIQINFQGKKIWLDKNQLIKVW